MKWSLLNKAELKLLLKQNPESAIVAGFVLDPDSTVMHVQLIKDKQYVYTRLLDLKDVNEDRFNKALYILSNNLVKVKKAKMELKE